MLLGVDVLITLAIGLSGGVLGSLVSPWAQGAAARATEQARSRDQHRRDMLSNGRNLVSEGLRGTLTPEQVANDWRYFHLRQHLTEARVTLNPANGYVEVLAFLDQLEKRWGLT